jgi:hypothetical protein
MTLAALAYEQDLVLGERVSLELRDLVFERGIDIASGEVLADLAARHGIVLTPGSLDDPTRVLADHAEGVTRGVVGSPHFFTPSGGFFCPALDVERDAQGHLRIHPDAAGFEAFLRSCFV